MAVLLPTVNKYCLFKKNMSKKSKKEDVVQEQTHANQETQVEEVSQQTIEEQLQDELKSEKDKFFIAKLRSETRIKRDAVTAEDPGFSTVTGKS